MRVRKNDRHPVHPEQFYRAAPVNLDVVVVTYESAETIDACLAALPPAAHLIVVDNASTDGSAEIAAKRAVVERRATNDGFAASANVGAQRARATSSCSSTPTRS